MTGLRMALVVGASLLVLAGCRAEHAHSASPPGSIKQTAIAEPEPGVPVSPPAAETVPAGPAASAPSGPPARATIVTGNWAAPRNDGFFCRAGVTDGLEGVRLRIWQG